MGLNAAVYRKITELPFTERDLSFVTVDPMTGQVDLDDAAVYQAWSDKVKVVEKRIGNAALVNELRTEVEHLLGRSSSTSLLIRRVLYNGTHSGDIIANSDLGLLKREIGIVRGIQEHQVSHELERFLAAMEELADASEGNGNPIVFI